MQKIEECPCCLNKGLHIELNKGYRLVSNGRKMSEYPFITVCKVCKRKIRYDVVKEKE